MQFGLNNDKQIYVQMVKWVEHNILLGVFKENEPIPSVADISVKYKINPVIIKKGIIVLIDKGIISCDLIVLNSAVNKLKMIEQKMNDVVFLDTETTGLNADVDEILQISIVNNNGDILLDSYIRPERNAEWKAAEEINHISYDMVKDAPLASDIAPRIFEIIANAKVVIAYNISFDWEFIIKTLENNGYVLDGKVPELKCCMKKFAEIYGEWNEEKQCYRWQKLSKAAEYYNIEWQGAAHGSLADTLMCRDLWNKMNEKKELNINERK